MYTFLRSKSLCLILKNTNAPVISQLIFYLRKYPLQYGWILLSLLLWRRFCRPCGWRSRCTIERRGWYVLQYLFFFFCVKLYCQSSNLVCSCFCFFLLRRIIRIGRRQLVARRISMMSTLIPLLLLMDLRRTGDAPGSVSVGLLLQRQSYPCLDQQVVT